MMNLGLTTIERSVNDSWERIENWLRDHAPLAFELLRPPATEAEISETEAKINKQFPPSVRLSYLRHNGTDDSPNYADSGQGIFDAYDFMSLNRVVMHDAEMKRLEREDGLDDYDTAKQIQILQFQCDFYCVESSSGAETTMNDWRSRGDEKHKPIAESFAVYLKSFADRLERGEEFYYVDDEDEDEYGRLLKRDDKVGWEN